MQRVTKDYTVLDKDNICNGRPWRVQTYIEVSAETPPGNTDVEQ